MKIERMRPLRGPNIWSRCTLIETLLWVDPDMTCERLLSAGSLLASDLEKETIGAAPAVGSSVADWVAHTALSLQQAAGVEVGSAFSRTTRLPGEYCIAVEYVVEEVGIRASKLAVEIGNAIREGRTVDLRAEIAELRHRNETLRLGPSTAAIVRAAADRGIPHRRLTDGSLVRLGHGARQRLIWAAETDRTSAVGESIAQDKDLTKSLIASAGVPVPKGRVALTADEAWQAAEAIGVPVVVKPRSGNQGRHVSVRLVHREAIWAAFEAAARRDGEVVVERHVSGRDYRLLVVGDSLVAAAERIAPQVEGDGHRTVRELVESENTNPKRGADHATALSKLLLDEIALDILEEQGLVEDSVPAAGQVVLLRRNGNLSTGGTAVDVTDEVHPDVARRAVEAARVVGLDIAGVDVIAPTVREPLERTGGAVVEVNAAPGLRMHLDPSVGTARAVGKAIVDSLFLPTESARVPIVAVTGTNGKTTTVKCIAHLLRQRGYRVGVTCTDGIYVDGHRIDEGDCSGPKSAAAVLGHPNVDAAVLETARGGILREGLGFDECDVAVVTNLGEGDHLGIGGIETLEELAHVKSVPVRAVTQRGAAVLNAGDPLAAAMAPLCRGTVIFFGRDPSSPAIVRHLAAGLPTVTIRDGFIVLAVHGRERRVARLRDLPLTFGGRVAFQTENVLASVAAAFWLRLPLESLRFGVETFSSDLATVPGRFNVLNHGGGTIILDYGHNASALLALTEGIGRMRSRRRKIVYTAAGDRRNADIVRQGEIIAGFFDEIFIYEDDCTRGRPAGEVMGLLRTGFEKIPRPRRVVQAAGEFDAIARAIHGMSPGDLLLCQVDRVERALEFVTHLLRQKPPGVDVPLGALPAPQPG